MRIIENDSTKLDRLEQKVDLLLACLCPCTNVATKQVVSGNQIEDIQNGTEQSQNKGGLDSGFGSDSKLANSNTELAPKQTSTSASTKQSTRARSVKS